MNILFRRVNSIAGWVIFALASMVYLLTMEPTASFWDCGEFIASSYKLEIGHPPGNPVYQLIGRIFSMFMPIQYVAPAINASSALCSGATILLLFWSITHIARRLMERNGETFTLGNIIAVIGTGTVGALVYTFSDTFWFSAVEAEVYAMSSLFTALVFWAILKWEEEADKPYAARWLILIAYLMGLSIGVHLLNLLAIPAIVFVYYFKKYKVSNKGLFWALMISGALVVLMLQFIPTVPKIAAYVDLFFVNTLGAPFNLGAVFAVLAMFAIAILGMIYTRRRQFVAWNSAFLMFIVAMIGYSTFAVIVIRSSANPPTNENQPDTPFALLYYLNREQYGSAPLFSGPSYASVYSPSDYTENIKYLKDGKKYRKIPMISYKYDAQSTMFFPRMHSPDPNHKKFYEAYIDANRRNAVRDPHSNDVIPSFWENLTFFFDYQFNWMYFRYFMWNFAGRQNDIQGHGNSYHGNWECGIPFIDKLRLGDMSDLPPYLAENKARNHYYMMPLILGLIGLLYQYRKDKRNFIVVMLLFILTGAAIIVYLNQSPFQPRERDYAFAGSFYAFAIWIGLGVYAIYDAIRKKVPATTAAAAVSAVCLVVPIQMGAVNWDDHDRSDRYFARDMAYNYLNSCDKDAILFTGGDNDTFPLWYAQEVEGARLDIRIVNLSLIQAEWYIDQMKRRQYDADPVPFTLDRNHYIMGTNDIISVREVFREPLSVDMVFEVLTNPRYYAQTQRGDFMAYMPTRNVAVPVNKEMLLAKGIVPEKSADRILDTIIVNIPKNDIRKPDLMILDLLRNNNWERPIHFVSVGNDLRLDFQNYLQYEGFTQKLVPLKPKETKDEMGRLILIDADALYDKLINVFRWTNMNKPGIFIDYNLSLTLTQVLRIRHMHTRAAEALLQEGKEEKAKEVLDSLMVRMPTYNFPANISALGNDIPFINIINLYYRLGEKEKADALAQEFYEATEKNLIFFSQRRDGVDDLYWNLMYLRDMSSMVEPYNEELADKVYTTFYTYASTMGFRGAE